MKTKRKKTQYLIGVEGGGTTTFTALADLNGKILDVKQTASSNPRNVGIEKAAENIAQGINKVLRTKKEVISVFIGLPAVAEEYRYRKKEIIKEISKRISKNLKSKLKLGTDQLVAFRSGTDQKEGIVLIAGTGCVAHGWYGKKEAKASGWGWLADEGSGFWTGQKVFQAVLKDIDGRGPKTALTKIVLKELKVNTSEKLTEKIHQGDIIKLIASFSVLGKQSAKRDKIARIILKEAGFEAGLTANAVIRKLNFKRKKFPLILVGGMFKSEIFLKTVKLYVKRIAPKADFILPKNKSVTGAIKLALEKASETRTSINLAEPI